MKYTCISDANCWFLKLFTFFRMFRRIRKWCRCVCNCLRPHDMFLRHIHDYVEPLLFDHTNCYAFPFAIASYFCCTSCVWSFHVFHRAIHAPQWYALRNPLKEKKRERKKGNLIFSYFQLMICSDSVISIHWFVSNSTNHTSRARFSISKWR